MAAAKKKAATKKAPARKVPAKKRASSKTSYPATDESWVSDLLPSWMGGNKVKPYPGDTLRMMYDKKNRPENRRLLGQANQARRKVEERRAAEKKAKKSNRRGFMQ